jgi:hypothetical protein
MKPIRAFAAFALTLSLLTPGADAVAQPGVQAAGQDGVAVGERSRVAGLVSAERIEREAAAQFTQLKQQAAAKNALAPDDHPQLRRLRRIAAQLIPHATRFNPRAAEWKWEV